MYSNLLLHLRNRRANLHVEYFHVQFIYFYPRYITLSVRVKID